MAMQLDNKIKKEKARLTKIYRSLAPDKFEIAKGLIERAAWMRVQCEELEKDIVEHGWTEPFRQSKDLGPYDRARPQGQAYQTLNGNYQKIIRQLDAMLPEKEPVVQDDGFDTFSSGRDCE